MSKRLSVISCPKCGYITMIKPTPSRDKRCRHCGAVIFSKGENMGDLVATARPSMVR